ncbi:PREDICTED: serine/threonine-protein kinase SMG1 [Nicrophorus vespilloides]|uniref:non-specific serine/threonine protein kinase n=1 Tax=Nicrophorus vespilloides TaxID=110193 RepID=A0ABM1N4Y1_NICVS|nr:PREDICTED: serine/threonine-protein kinase SMG1 [Nicrophorus vespilloides]
MITNNTGYKLKASKSSPNNDYQDQDENESLDGDATGDSNNKYQIYSTRDGKQRATKSRGFDYVNNKPGGRGGTDRRGTFRGRNNLSASRRNDRDFTNGINYSNRFDSGMYAYKYTEPEKKAEIKFNLLEDTRISKLLRRLSNEEDQENSLQISKRLLEVLLLPDNATYIRKSFTILRDSMLNIFQVAPGPLAKKQCAKALGRMGYILGHDEFDFTKYFKLIFKQKTNEETTCLLMEALKETYTLEREKPTMEETRANSIIVELIAIMESTDNIEIFKLTLDNLMSTVEFWPSTFHDHFKDTIDLVFGWHVDFSQPLSNIEFISRSLQRIAFQFQMNFMFSITLIVHFVEDIETYSEQMKMDDKSFDNNAMEQTTVYILALNTVLNCLNNSSTANDELFTLKLKFDALNQVISTLTEALEYVVPDNLIIAGNETICLLLTMLPTKSILLNESILQLVDLQISIIHDLSDATIISMLIMISKVIKELSAKLPIELITKLVGPNSEIVKLRNSPYKDIQVATIGVYQALLNLKNIPLLQEAYKYILFDLDVCLNVIVPSRSEISEMNPFTPIEKSIEDAELACLFLLRSLSQLANASGSIIGMWALKPSILELLAVTLQPFNEQLSRNAPTLQYSILFLLYSHCKCYNHFISSSTLVTDKLKGGSRMGLPDHIEDVAKSPNSGNFSIILNVLHRTLLTKINNEIILLLLQWFNEILFFADPYLEVIYNNLEFSEVTGLLVRCCYVKNNNIILAASKNLEKLLGNKQLSWCNDFLQEINKLCSIHMASANSEVRNSFSKLSSHIPWDVAIAEIGKSEIVEANQSNLSNYTSANITLAQHLHLNGTVFGEITSHHFKKLMDFMLKNECNDENLLETIFLNCWPLESDNQQLNDQFRELCTNSQIVLNNWITWEAAQFCVNNKLRTPLGKPNETFTSFENSLKHYARDVMKIKQEDNVNVNQKHVRLLLQFIEHLEMCIYNASEGSAIAIPQPSKPVRTFFSTNASTCREWLSRIRIVLVQLSLHAGQSVMALRHGQAMIKDLYNNNKTDTVDFERGVMYMTMALLNLRESEALHGLYMWCLKDAGKKYDWIKCAAEQANKKYEYAAVGYQKLIDEILTTNENQIDTYIKHFISDQIVRCYKEMNNWLDIVGYKNNKMNLLLNPTENGIRHSFNIVNFDCAQAIFNSETCAFAYKELCSWDVYEDDSWSVYDTLTTTESELYNIALNIGTTDTDFNARIQSKLSKIQSTIQNGILQLPSDFHQEFCLLNYVANGLQNISNNVSASTVFLVSDNFEREVVKVDSVILTRILWWSEYFTQIQNQGFSAFSSNLRLNIIKQARKESNYNMASSQLYRFLSSKSFLKENNPKTTSLLVNIAESFKAKLPEISMWNMDTAQGAKELIKLIYEDTDDKRLAFDLCAVASTSISKYADIYRDLDLKQVSSKILLKLATWLQSNDSISLSEFSSPLGKLLMVLPEIGVENIGNNIIPLNDMVIGKLLQFSVNQCQTLSKTWYAFGTWCYSWGKKIVDNSSDFTNTLSLEDQNAIQSLLPLDCKPEDLNRILMILSQTRTHVDEEDIDSNEINTSEMIKNQLKNVHILFNAPETVIDTLVQIWRNLQKRVYAYYEHSVDAYFNYLHLATYSENISKATESNTITVTLRLLRLIVKHALELQIVLERGLTRTPTHPWKVIIPQLFSRLNHPESYVRERVSDLLCRVAEDAPHLITFPAVVGALEGGVKFDFSEISLPKDCLSQNNDINDDSEINEIEDNYESDDESKNVLQSCFKSMVETLSNQAAETITQVQLLVKELRRIILLWDELWLGTLTQHQGEITKRQQQLEIEIEKVNSNLHLSPEEKISIISEKHRIILTPIVFILDQLYDITSVEPETPHEQQFQDKYLTVIRDVLKKLKNPENPDKPQETWQVIKDLQHQFQQKAHKRNLLKMKDISPVLANIKDTEISMPGQALKTNVRISHVSNQVSILPTKTKPKKLVFHGSDGQTYTYLFKGLEDLHLDERIMQFLSIANTMMAQNTEGTGHNLYRARHYSVIPLGPRSGLISWVGGTTPVFAVYKRWQQREALKASKNVNTTTVLRPSELFYNKLNPLLVEHGVKNIENRKEWPLVVLKQVLTELMNETPSNLLAKELWCHAVNAGEWWQIVRKYTYSVAVMSIIGYIIGLGDRHLDNVLVDLNTGEVVHIDYNVCFEKGKTLRVPEKVPFRLTPNIRDALGATGVEGMFRLSCENILKIMKKGRETLLTLLEAFVYDPLVDWTVGNDGLVGTTFGSNSTIKQSRRVLEKEVTLSMYRVRCTELKMEWDINRIDIHDKLPCIRNQMKEWLECWHTISITEDLLQDLHQQMALVKEAEANGLSKHSLLTLPSRYESYRRTKDVVTHAKQDLDKIVSDCEIHLDKFMDAIKTLQTQQTQQWFLEMQTNVELKTVFSLVKEFLQNAGQSSMISQCEQSENDVKHLAEQQTLLTTKCLNILQEYWTIYSQCPVSFLENHRMYHYLKWGKMLQNTRDLSIAENIFQQLIALKSNNSKRKTVIINFSYHLNVLYNSTVEQLSKAFEELQVCRVEESSASSEARYLESKKCLANFLAHEKGANRALEFVIVSELLLLNRTFLTLENTASKSGDWLVKLASRDSDWFLDDISMTSAKAIELINILNIQNNIEEDSKLMKVVKGLHSANDLYKSLHELSFNFHTIILPESWKKIQSEEPTVLLMINDLNNMIVNIGVSLPDLVVQLEKHLTCVIMEMDQNPTYEVIQNKISTLKMQYQLLLHSNTPTLSPGKMLLMGFNGLFDKLNLEFDNLANILINLEIPACWRKVDHVKEAKSLAAPIFNPQVRAVLEDIFFLKRLQTMYEFFSLCMKMYTSFQGQGRVTVLSDEELIKPIRKFIADFISRQFLGITTEAIAYIICFILQRLGLDVTNEIEQKDIGAEHKVPLDELYHIGWNNFLKNGTFTQNVLAQTSSIENNVKSAWEKMQEPKKLEKNVTLLQSSVSRIQNQISIHFWLYEEIISSQIIDKNNCFHRRIIQDLRKIVADIMNVQSKIFEAREKQKNLIASVEQRLKWAAGANPDLNNTMIAFEEAIAERNNHLEVEKKVTSMTVATCSVILHHEALRNTTPESSAYDQVFLNTHAKWTNACQYNNVKVDAVSLVEENIMKLYSQEMTQNPKWINQISEKVSETIKATQKDLSEYKAKLHTINADVLLNIESFKKCYSDHCKVTFDFRNVLKAMSKMDECGFKSQQFLNNHKTYIDIFSGLLMRFKKEEFRLPEIEASIENLDYLACHTDNIYKSLFELESKKAERPQLVRQDGMTLSPMRAPPSKQESMTKGQQRNAYAVSVWRRVRMKLSGKDPDPGRKYSIQEQVDYVIREASSLDNLALLYEGWTPWV